MTWSGWRGRAARPALLPDADWIGADIATLTTPAQWRPLLTDIDAVVNASGVLQNGAGDDVAATQRDAIVALVAACAEAGPRRFVQISAPGAVPDAETAFLRTKGEADAALMASDLDWTILRPGVVLAPSAYGGTSLLRLLAAFPLVQPIVLADARVQTVAVDDVAEAVLTALTSDTGGRAVDLVEDNAHTLEAIVGRVRAWQGFAEARAVIRLPRAVGHGVARFADLAGWLGWRSALRSTSLRVLAANVVGDPEPWRAATGRPLKSLDETLRALPSTAQERIYARAQLAFPLLLFTLSAFWIVSGAIGAWQLDAAAAVLAGSLAEPTARAAVLVGSALDIAIGLAVLVRRLVRPACWAAVLVAVSYLIGGTILTPQLWADPLGPLVKVFPAIALALAVAALAEDR